ncbi:MAG: hypothetical protein JST22_06880 [Bacteroidetes bacterium]|nr:hypothetical protein [Bacteroidota bacterium]
MSQSNDIELVVSGTARTLLTGDEIQEIADKAVAECRMELAQSGPPRNHLYRMYVHAFETVCGTFDTLTTRRDERSWVVLIGTPEEIAMKLRQHREEDEAASN